MQLPEKLNQAELTFRYTHYSNLLKLTDTYSAGEVLVKLWDEECQGTEPRRYVLFLDNKKQLITWKQLPLDLSHTYCAREIAGLAIACNASNIIMSHLRLKIAKPNQRDKDLTRSTFEICEQHKIEVLDYLIITPSDCVSYKLWLLNCY